MRKTTVQLVILILVGTIIFWREWATNSSIRQQLELGTEKAVPFINSSPNTIIWLVVVAGGLWVIAEIATRYLKLSSPNSV